MTTARRRQWIGNGGSKEVPCGHCMLGKLPEGDCLGGRLEALQRGPQVVVFFVLS